MMQSDPQVKNEVSSATKTLRQSTLHLGFCLLHFGMLTEKLVDGKSRSLLFKLSGPEPKQSGGKVNVLTLGLKMIRYGERIKLGLITRKQILEKA